MKTTAKTFLCRWLLSQDVDGAVALMQECFTEPWDKRQLLRFLGKQKGLSFAAVYDDRPVGVVCFRGLGKVLVLESLCVTVPWRRLGVGKTLIDCVCRGNGGIYRGMSADKRSCCFGLVDEENLAALMLLKSRGFRAPLLKNPQRGAILMRKTCWD